MKRRTILRAAAILPVFALKKNYAFGRKPVHILDINAVPVGAPLKPTGLRSIQGRDQRQLQQGPLDPSWQDDPGTKKYFDFMAKYHPDGDKACVVTGGAGVALLARADLILRRGSNGVRSRVAASLAGYHAGSSMAMTEQIGDFQTDAQPTGALQPARTPHPSPNKRNVVLSWQAFLSNDNFRAQCCYRARSPRMVGSRRGVGPDPALTGWS